MRRSAAPGGRDDASPGAESHPTDLDLGVLRNLFLSYSPSSDYAVLDHAYRFARAAHEGQKRVSGEPYITHPVEVATILAEHRFDGITLAAALLHDVIEDCDVTEDRIAAEFGAEIAGIVLGVTKISTISEQTRQQTQAENLRRMLVAVARDIRVLLIKLADRLHNMRTLDALDPSKIERLSRETLEIYAPLAYRMGMSTIKSELEDLSFRHLMPQKYAEIAGELERLAGERRVFLEEAKKTLHVHLADAGIQATVTSRVKEVYSTYKKMSRQNRPITEIYDLLGTRILVSSAKDCYGALGIVHTLWRPMPRRFKDYVAIPKPNLYQALHTTVIGPGNVPLEIQIKTHQMHLTAEEGIAAHWKYKAGEAVDERLGWLKRILEWQREAVSAEEFMDSLRIDLFADQVFVLTPKGDIIELPAGSTPVDAAYAIHTEIGNRLAGAKVDGRMVPITSRLVSGAVVEIITSSSARPSRDWLDAVRTPRARAKIRHFLKEQGSGEFQKKGAELLQAALNRARAGLSIAQKSEALVRHAHDLAYKDLESLLEAIGFGTESAEGVARRIADRMAAERLAAQTEHPAAAPKASARKTATAGTVVVEGIADLVIRFGKCCNPVPGDDIIGYLSRGRGVSIHRANCRNAAALSGETARFVNAHWAGSDGHFSAGVTVEGDDRIGLLADITQAIAREGGNILSADIRTRDVGRDLFVIQVSSAAHLERIMRALENVPGARKVLRAAPR
jgi:GTP pyrophosphokinase